VGEYFYSVSVFSQYFKFVLIDRSICAEIEIFGVSREFLLQSILKSREKYQVLRPFMLFQTPSEIYFRGNPTLSELFLSFIPNQFDYFFVDVRLY
jgi:hypothetical protein